MPLEPCRPTSQSRENIVPFGRRRHEPALGAGRIPVAPAAEMPPLQNPIRPLVVNSGDEHERRSCPLCVFHPRFPWSGSQPGYAAGDGG